jgi:predicted permease
MRGRDPEHERVPAWRRYLRFWGSDVRADVDEELGFHIDGLINEYVRAGMDPAAARRSALQRFGDIDDVTRTLRTLAEQRETSMRRTEWLDALRRDVRYALRQLAKRPGFTTIALAVLALGIGANTAIFSAANRVLLRPVATHDIDRLVVVQTNLPTMNLLNERMGPGEALDVMKRTDLFQASTAWASRTVVLTERGEPRQLLAVRTMGQFFDVFGLAPAVGRLYRPDESERDQHRVAVLSHPLFEELGSDPRIIGTNVQLNGVAYQVVGVAPRGFYYPRGAQVYVPQPINPDVVGNRSQLAWNTVGRMKAGLTLEQFRAGIRNEQERWHRHAEWRYDKLNQFLTVVPLTTMLAGQLRTVLFVLLAAVGFVLLIACTNVASLQLVHATARSKEIAVRAALGAGRGVLVRQMLVENLVLSVGGGVLGVFLGLGMLAVLQRAGAGQLPQLDGVRLDGTVLAFTAATTMVAGLLCGLGPAARAGRVDLNETLRESGRTGSIGARKNRVLQSGVVAQVALTVLLLLGSGLMIRSLVRLLSEAPGFNPQHVITVRTTLSGPRYASETANASFFATLLDRLRAVPGVSSVGLVSELPFSGTNNSSPFRIIGREPDPNGPALHANMHSVSDDYFVTAGIPLIRGRTFTAADVKEVPHGVVIDAQLARLYFPNEDPIGKQINQGPDATIIGVVGTVSQNALGEPPKATTYYSFRQHSWYSTYFVTIRTKLPSASIVPSVRQVVNGIDPNVPVYDVSSLENRISASLAPRRLAMIVLTSLSAVSLLLSVLGLYGVTSYAVSQRTIEFGIRSALGAQPGQVRGLVLRQGLRMAIAGVLIGVVAASVATRGLAALMFGVSPHDPFTFVAAALLVIVIAGFASYIPARRATRLNLVDALRAE